MEGQQISVSVQQGLNSGQWCPCGWREITNFVRYSAGNSFFSRKEEVALAVEPIPLGVGELNVVTQNDLSDPIVSL
jgi:hypothetical protein